jgi:hypothetical protein
MMLVGAAPALLVFLIRLAVPRSRALAALGGRRHRAPRWPRIFGPALRPRTLLGIALASWRWWGPRRPVQWIPLWVTA